MPATMPEESVTQIIHLRLKQEHIDSIFSSSNWQQAIDNISQTPHFIRASWFQSLEHPQHIELHILRPALSHHKSYLVSEAHKKFLGMLSEPLVPHVEPVVRHAALRNWTPASQALDGRAPFTGTAIYLNANAAWNEGAWPLWTHVVRHIDGCLGCSGGMLLDSDVSTIPGSLGRLVSAQREGSGRQKFEGGFLVYVGWETTEKHHAYHHTKHFAEHSVILRCGNEGYAEYGHVVLKGRRDGKFSAGSRL